MDSSRKPCASVGIAGNPKRTNDLSSDDFFLDTKPIGVYSSGVTNPISEAARLLGSIKTKKKAKSSRENGKKGGPFGHLGGRPRKPKKNKGKAA